MKSREREEARRLRREEGLPASEIGRILGRSQFTVAKWIRGIEITPEQKYALKRRQIDAAIAVISNPKMQQEAERLRREYGLSVTEIARELGVPQPTVSTWVKNIELTPEQKSALQKQRAERTSINQHRGAESNRLKALKLREEYQAEGRQKARERDQLHVAGCMLYWGEGSKERNSLTLANSDPDMIRFFVMFLRDSLGVADNDIVVRCNCYLNNGISLDAIEKYWLEIANLPPCCLRKSSVNSRPVSSQQKSRKLPYGTCSISVYQTRLVQHVFGAIQEYIGVDKPEWLR